jgi:N-acetylmuramic acid 6-phosphate etherase
VIRARSARESGGLPDEDSDQRGEEAVVEAGITSRDIVVGVASSGSTPFTTGAQKLWLNVFSTAVMVTLGLTFDNLMVNVAPSLGKLRARRLAILQEATGLGASHAAELLDAAGNDLRAAIVMALADVDLAGAEAALEGSGGRVRAAVSVLGR